MRAVRFILWFPVYWLLSVLGMFIPLISFALGGGVGVMLYRLFFKFPHQSVFYAVLFMAFFTGGGLYANSLVSKRWKRAIGRILERMDRDMNR